MVAIEDARFYEHGGLDVQGTLRALRDQPRGRRGAGGRLDAHPAAGQADPAADRATRPRSGPPRPSRPSAASCARPGWRWRWRRRTARTSCSPATSTSSTSGRTPTASSRPRRAFFGVDAAALTLPQAALLAGLVQSPTDDDPFADPEAATIRRNQVLARMADAGLHHAGRAGRRDRRAARPRPGPGAAPGLRRRRAWARTSATSCRST